MSSSGRFILPAIAAFIPACIMVILAAFISSPRASAVSPVAPPGSMKEEAAKPEPVRKVVSVAPGDAFSGILLKEGVNQNEVLGIVDTISKYYDPRYIQPGQQISLTFDPEVPFYLESVELQMDPLRDLTVKRAENQSFAATVTARRTMVRERAVSGTINDALFSDGIAAGVPASVLMDLIDVYSFDIDFQHDIHRGDRFAVMWQEYVDTKGDPVQTGSLLEGRLQLKDQTVVVYGFAGSNGHMDYYDSQGRSARKTLLKTPIHGAVITSPFGWRADPFSGYSDFHRGIDFGAPPGTPILAAGDGTVISMSYDGIYGNHVLLRHINGYVTLYAHMEAYARGLRVGDRVAQGKVIGYVGSTGESTGPHVHYEVRVWGKPVNPATLRFPPGRTLSGAELNAFLIHVRHLDGDFETALGSPRSRHS
ncbi:MAG TPA: peptidoglycan DD-metalloendopeptidase family protein [Spirochaetia bacterium]|nr:peptidoglycan DD-metalloendopeptidase family protein [Spirochaetia bacterium]